MDTQVDPRIVAFAGPLPPGLDLEADTATSDRAAIIAILILALIAVALRFAARTVQHTKIHWDDWIIVLGMVFVSGTAGLAIAGTLLAARRSYRNLNLLTGSRRLLRRRKARMGRQDE